MYVLSVVAANMQTKISDDIKRDERLKFIVGLSKLCLLDFKQDFTSNDHLDPPIVIRFKQLDTV